MMKKTTPEYWFATRPPAHGWGWGAPLTWQGWVVLVGFFVLLIAGSVLVLPYGAGMYLAYVFVLSALLIFICAKKGGAAGRIPGPGRQAAPPARVISVRA